MITLPTVFVLGAGTSWPYRFPVGTQLTENICADILSSNSPVDSADFRRAKIGDAGHFIDLANKLRASGGISIDEWLARNSHFREAGKICIARAISGAEGTERSQALEGDDWIGEIWRHYIVPQCEKIEDLKGNAVVFVTFNYDRSLEHYLYQLIRNTFTSASEEEAIKAARHFKIVHVHGRVGCLPWQEMPAEVLRREFQGDNGWGNAKECAKSIYIISELEPLTDEYISARKALHTAKRIVFLGFGFHDENMRRLKPVQDTEKIKADQVIASTFGLHPRDLTKLHTPENPWGQAANLIAHRSFRNTEVLRQHVHKN